MAADIRCIPRTVESLEPRTLLSGVALQSANDPTTHPLNLHANLGAFAAGVPAVVVVDNAFDVNDGDYRAGRLSLREAVFLANSDPDATTITFSKRLPILWLSQVGDTSADNSALAITSAVTIIGPAGGSGVTLIGTGSSGDLRLFLVKAGGDLTLRNLTMTNWATDDSGGAIKVEAEGTATLTKCVVSNSFAAAEGGGIFNFGTLTLTDSTLIGNRARDGGGLMNYSLATLTGSTLSNNRATEDGGGFNSVGGRIGPGDDSSTLTNCLLIGNTAGARGGGFCLSGFSERPTTLTNCRLVGNSAHDGGGVANSADESRLTLDHSTITGNRAINGGGIYNATGPKSPQVGSGGGGAGVDLSNCTITSNSAERGGGLYNLSSAGLTNCTVTGNHANYGGGIFYDSPLGFFNTAFSKRLVVEGILNISGTVLSANTAVLAGGGLFNNGNATVNACQFTRNFAAQGSALYNDLSSAALTGCLVTANVSARGTQLFNHLGVLTLANSTVADSAHLTFLPNTGPTGIRFVAPMTGVQPSATAAPTGGIVVGPDGIRYAFTRGRELLRQLPGCGWTILDDGVQNFKIAPNGDCYWLNDRGELFRAQAGYVGSLIGAGVQSFAMDQHGTVYNLSNLDGPGNFAAYASLTAPLLDPVEEPLDGTGPHFAHDPPTIDEVVQATGLGGPEIQHLQMVIEPIVDSIDAPRYFPNIGLAQLHRALYKCTVYYSTELNGEASGVIYLDRNHLHRYVPGQVSPSVLPSQASSPVAAITSASAAVDSIAVSRLIQSDNILSLFTGPDGTIYKLGGDFNGIHRHGQPAGPLVLWRLPPRGNWQPLVRVESYAVAPDNTLYALTANHVLQRLAPGASQWSTLATGVQSFTMAPNGTVYQLNADHTLRRLSPGSNQWATLDVGVLSFSMTPDGTVYELNDGHQLRRLINLGQWSVFITLDTGVQSFTMADDGTVYELNGRQQLVRWTGQAHGWPVRTVLDRGVQSFQRDADGTIYSLNNQHQLRRLTSRDHWTVVDVGVQSFVVAPNAFRNVYVVNSQHELKRLEAGYSWSTLRTDAVSLTIDSSGVVTARDTLNRSWKYWSPPTVPVVDPLDDPGTPIFCQDSPSRADVLQLLHIPDGPSVTVVMVEPTVDGTDPPRLLANLTIPTKLHHCHYQCTVQYTTAQGLQTQVIDIDVDHLIRSAGAPLQ